MRVKPKTQEAKLKRIVDLHLDYAKRQKDILEAQKIRRNYLYNVEERKQNQRRAHIHNDYDQIISYLKKNTHLALHPDIVTRQKDNLKELMEKTYGSRN